ncbi:MAG: asparagine synthase (glutamine-hydrolyzing) [Thioalkalivibrionaceae bacterium]
MCGIAGVFHAEADRPVDRETLVAMAAIQYHRGPDGFGVLTQDDRGIGFSHARLSIIDLDSERGRQPFCMSDGSIMTATNGELYDYKRIRTDLTSRGVQFRSKSDSEMVMHLYRRHGLEDTLPHLRGEFAIAIYDRAKDRLMLIRDRFGVKPLYFTEVNGQFIFGSELKVLFAHPDVPRRFSNSGLFHQLMQTIVPGTTAFEGIHQVAPGQVVIVERAHGRLSVRAEKYWDMDFPLESERDPDAAADETPWIEGVREHLMEAVALRLEADVPVACYLSGGIDSCITLGLSAAQQQSPVKAFTIGFDSKEYDESAIAREMAESVGADQDILRLEATHLYDHFVETLWHTERTIYNTLGVAKMLMSRHVHESGYKVVVTGEGSDELFAGYPAFRLDLFRHGLDHMPPAERASWEHMLAESNKLFRGAMIAEDEVDNPALTAAIGFTPACLQPWLAAGQRVPALLQADRRAALSGYDPGAAIAETFDKQMLEGRHPLDRAQYVWTKTQLEGQILTWGGDRVDMANSMEARPPFLDHHLAEFAVNLPPSLRIKGRTEKYVLREAMKGLLPKVLYEREKFAFMAPPAHTDAAKWAKVEGLAREYLSPDAIRDAGLLDQAGVQAIFDLHQSPDADSTTQVQLDAVINHMIGVQVLHRHFIATDIPRLARDKARELGWLAAA